MSLPEDILKIIREYSFYDLDISLQIYFLENNCVRVNKKFISKK